MPSKSANKKRAPSARRATKAKATKRAATKSVKGDGQHKGKHSSASARDAIVVQNARTHNLKNLSVEIPHGELTVITGVSGSGKSSLAFDTIYAEGQRRFVESLSTYARQFLQKMARPDADAIHGLQPAIALEQKNSVTTARSTVGTVTEVNDYLRLLYARCSELICPDCNLPVHDHTAQSAAQELCRAFGGGRVYLLATVHLDEPELAEVLRDQLQEMGFYRLWWRGEVAEFADLTLDELADYDRWEVLIDRLKLPELKDGKAAPARLLQAISQAFQVGKGKLLARLHEKDAAQKKNGKKAGADILVLHQGLICDSCGRQFRAPEPPLFSFYSPLGACPTCEGLGRTIGIDWAKCIPNHSLSINEGAIACWSTPGARAWLKEFKKQAPRHKIPLDVPYKKLSKVQQKLVRLGTANLVGIKDFFDDLAGQRYKVQARIMLARYRAYENCPTCDGSRLVKDALWHWVGGKTIHDLQSMPLEKLRAWIEGTDLERLDLEGKTGSQGAKAAERLLRELRSRLAYLNEVGLGYLTLQRQTRTLSGGEAQRIHLATALGSALTETMYVLDEPTVGLHPRDTHRLIGVLEQLRENGNTVLVVEHDKDVMRAAERILDIGPGAGEQGGELLYDGPVEKLEEKGKTLTADFLRRDQNIKLKNKSELRRANDWIRVEGARGNNLKYLDIDFPLGIFAVVVGVSGSGKTTLVRDTLYAGYKRLAEQSTLDVAEHDIIKNWDKIGGMTFVDQTPIGRSSRSNPVTYTGGYDAIRKLMAGTPEARRLGRTEGDFSFNVKGGRCDECEGTGFQTIDLHFLGEVNVPCELCDGKRFKDFMLAIKWRGKNIHDILQLTVKEAREFFSLGKDAAERRVMRALEPLEQVGLGYLRLGQSTATLSGGELQRLKLASYIGGSSPTSPQLLIFDEPTTGLHPADLHLLLESFEKLVDLGYSLLVVEHNVDLISRADWLIELGPEAGEAGGRLVYSGAPQGLLKSRKSQTAKYLRG